VSAAPSQPRVAPPRTALDDAVEADIENIMQFLAYVCGKRGVRDDTATEAIGRTFEVAFTRERAGQCWDPKVEVVALHLAGILVDTVLRSMRRTAKRKPTSPMEDEHDVASEAATAEESFGEHEEETSRAAEVRRVLAAETVAGLTLRILDALRAGIEGHENLAVHLKCTVAEVRAAYRRINRRTEHFRGGSPKKTGQAS